MKDHKKDSTKIFSTSGGDSGGSAASGVIRVLVNGTLPLGNLHLIASIMLIFFVVSGC